MRPHLSADAMTRTATPPRTKLLIATLALGVAAIALCLNRDLNGDLYLLLFSGRYVAHHGPVGFDPFPTIEHGREWLNQQWLSEVGFYGTERVVGTTGITVLYALLLALPLALLLIAIRRKGSVAMIAVAAAYVPGISAIIHPRAAGFTLLLFAILVLVILAGWGPARSPHRRLQALWALLGLPAVFALWANLHGGFIAGLLLVGLVTVGLAIDRRRALPGPPGAAIVLLGAGGLLGLIAVTFATPLGPDIWSYVSSFRNSALKLASTEWQPVTQSLPAIAYLLAAVGIAVWTWWSEPPPRRVIPALVAAGFVAFAASSMRNLVFVAPALAFQIACSAPDRVAAPRKLLLAAAAAAVAGGFVVYGLLGTPDSHRVGNPAVRYAIKHPLPRGRIVAYAGPSSYMLWRAPDTPVAINGWLEHFTEEELRANFGILQGSLRDPTPYVRRLDAGAVVAYIPKAIARLERHGFVAKVRGPYGTYLVRTGAARSG